MSAYHYEKLLQTLLETRTVLAFRGILGILDASPNPSNAPYLLDVTRKALSSWPDSLRFIDVNGLPLPTIVNSNGWSLIRTIRCDESLETIVRTIDGREHSLVGIAVHAYDNADLAALAQSRMVEHLESLDITLYDASHDLLREVLSRLRRLTSLTINVIRQHDCDVWNVLRDALSNSRLRSLQVSGFPSGFAQDLFSHCPPTLTKLGCFRLSYEEVSDLCRSQELCSKLHTLTLERNHIGNEGIAAIASCPYLTRLEVLQLPFNDITSEGIASLKKAKFLDCLRELDLSDNPIGDQGVASIVETPLRGIERLIISGGKVTAKGCHSLREANQLADISVLRLDVNEIADSGVIALVNAPALQNVVSLGVGVNGITVKGVTALAEAERLSNVKHLWLDGNDIGDGGIQPLTESSFLKAIRLLDVGNCAIGDGGAVAISKGKWLCLQSLNLWNTGIGDTGVVAIAGSSSLSQLLDLNLYRGTITDVGIESLASSTELRSLVRLVIGDVNCTDGAITKLASSDVVSLVDEIGISSHFESWLASSSLRPIAKEYIRKAQRQLNRDDA